jgi:hypothetical protein
MNSKFMSDNIIITLLIIYSGITFLLVGCSNNKYNDYIKIEKGVSQLFIDDYLIESHENLKRTLHQPAKDNNGEKPVIAIENEFEGLNATLEANGTIVYDPRIEKYVMFALGYSRHWREVKKRRWDSVRLYRFTSKDGINWVKGDNGIPQWVFPQTKKDLYDPKSNSYATFFLLLRQNGSCLSLQRLATFFKLGRRPRRAVLSAIKRGYLLGKRSHGSKRL